jgi:hypothetical protein
VARTFAREGTVEEQVRAVASENGSVDVSFNLITRGDVQGTPLVDHLNSASGASCATWNVTSGLVLR